VGLFDTSRSSNSPAEGKNLQSPLRFYRKRNRFYTLLSLAVVVVGLPIVSVPHLRNRLSERIMLLKAAVAGDVKPAIAQVGANQEPFPSEYERPEPPVYQAFKLPPSDRVIPKTPTVYIPSPADLSEPGTPSGLNQEGSQLPIEGEESVAQDEAAGVKSEDSGLKYQQGEMEQEAYNLLLESNAKIAGMVRGSNPSMIFDSWDAVKRGDDIYWVRVKFRSEGDPVSEYIWEVKLSSKEITPLSYHARSIS